MNQSETSQIKEEQKNKILEKYLEIKIITIKELFRIGFSLREISRRLGGNSRDTISRIIRGFDNG